jgi:DNA invertase Pin-like site-specific DNA recombinase
MQNPAIGQFEREMMLERQREGIPKAKAHGKYRGRASTARRRCKRGRWRSRVWGAIYREAAVNWAAERLSDSGGVTKGY